MPRIQETTVYKFDELSDEAKEKARDWYRECSMYDKWWESIYEDAERIGLKIKGFDIGRGSKCEAEFIKGPVDCAERIVKEHGDACETYKTAKTFLETHDEDGDEYEEQKQEFLYSLQEDYRIILEKELEWLQSDEQVDESIIVNEYEFIADGKIA